MPIKNNKRNQSLKAGKKRRAAQSQKKAGEHARKMHAKGAAVPKTVGRAPKKKLAVAAFAPVVPDPTLDNQEDRAHRRDYDGEPIVRSLSRPICLWKMGVQTDGLTNLMHNSYKGVDYFPKRRTQTAFLTSRPMSLRQVRG
jgi:hypothetical protein